jgi:3-hexulose-6-phosphate synthase
MIMAKPLIQLALDSLDYEQTIKLAELAAPYVDILEVGTPCIKHNGIQLVYELKSRFPGKQIFADLKTMDAGLYEAKPFYMAGANICTVLGTADLSTIKGVIEAANAYGKEAQVDLINVENKTKRAAEVAELGAHIIGIHTGIDQQLAGQTPFADLENLLALGLNVKVSVAGGINKDTVEQVAKSKPSIIVIGGAITGASCPAESARQIRALVDAVEA